MIIDVYGGAMCLLEHFIYYSTMYWQDMAAAMYYDKDAFCQRARLLEEIFLDAQKDLR